MTQQDRRRESRDFLRKLLDDKEWEHKKAERKLIRIEAEASEKVFFASLERIGVVARDFDELLSRYAPFGKEVVDHLLESIHTTKQPQVRDMIVRMLCATKMSYDGRMLAEAFEETENECFKWSIANTIACSRPTGLEEWLLDVLANPAHGHARQMLCIAAGRIQPRRAPQVLRQVFDDMPAYASRGLRLCGDASDLDFMREKCSSATNWSIWQSKTVATSIRWLERKLSRRYQKGKSIHNT